MIKLITRVEGLGFFAKELKANIGINRAFEGYSGRASETWETQYTFTSNEIIGPTGKVIFPALDMKSKPYESFDKFIFRVEEFL